MEEKKEGLKIEVQLQAQLIALYVLIAGALVTGIYFIVYNNFALWYKIVLAINAIGIGVLLYMSSLGIKAQLKVVKQFEMDKEEALRMQETYVKENFSFKNDKMKGGEENAINKENTTSGN